MSCLVVSPSFLMPMSSGSLIGGAANGSILRSNDAQTWVVNTSNPFFATGHRVMHIAGNGQGVYVATSHDPSGKVCTSIDGGDNWFEVTPVAGSWVGVACDGNKFIIVTNQRIAYSSTNGVNWTDVSSTVFATALPGGGNGGATHPSNIGYDKTHNSFVMTGYNSSNNSSAPAASFSMNGGDSWTGSNGMTTASSAGTGGGNIAAGNWPTIYAAFGGGHDGSYFGSIMVSSDGGANFATAFSTSSSADCIATYGAPVNKWLAGAGTPQSSSDGVNFSPVNPGIGSIQAMEFCANKFVVGDSSGTMAVSPDTQSWTSLGQIVPSGITCLYNG